MAQRPIFHSLDSLLKPLGKFPTVRELLGALLCGELFKSDHKLGKEHPFALSSSDERLSRMAYRENIISQPFKEKKSPIVSKCFWFFPVFSTWI